MRTFAVSLNQELVGYLQESDDGIRFRFSKEYLDRPFRPALGQFFEDDLTRAYRGSKGRLPPFFDNLVPEGQLLKVLERSFDVHSDNGLDLLVAVGSDLPGAVEIASLEKTPEVFDEITDEVQPGPEADSEDEPGFR